MKTSEVLRKAGDVLRERGWCQGGFTDEQGRVCIYGAIVEAAGDYGWIQRSEFVDLAVGAHVSSAPWNDSPRRTQAEVEVALDAAYILALQDEGVEPEDVL